MSETKNSDKVSVYANSSSDDNESAFDAEYWQSVYDNCNYEGAKYYDPNFEWEEEEEKKLIRRLDVRVMFWAILSFCALDLVRRNVTRAVADNFLDDLNINTNDYNLGQTLFYISFLSFELPGNLLTKKFGAEIVIPAQICAWSIVCIFQALLKNRTGFLITRVLLGLSQGGFIPDTILYLSYYYTSFELPWRLALFWAGIPSMQILGSLLASGILQMRGIHNLAGWKYLFLIEGILSLAIGVANWYFMRAGPTSTGNKLFNTKPWANEREVKILVNRVLRDDPSKGDMNNRQAVPFLEIIKTLREYDLIPLLIQGLLVFIPQAPVATYISLILRDMGYSTFMSNILAIPGQAWFLINLLILVYFSRKFNEKTYFVGISNYFIFPFLVALVALPHESNKWVKYVLLTAVASQPYSHPIIVAWTSQISNSVKTRAVASSFYNMSVQVGSIVASQIYRDDDKPYYDRGNKVLLGICCANIVLSFLVKTYYKSRNSYKEREWSKMTKEEQYNYRRTTKHTGSRRLDFRIPY